MRADHGSFTVAIGSSSDLFAHSCTMPVRKMESQEEDIIEQICVLQKRLRALQRMPHQASDEAATQHRCLHESKVLEDNGPRDNGELTYRCLTCGAVF